MKDALLGTVVDNRFEIQKRIGEGGMGTVYQAWQRSIGREVAIKMIDQRVAGDMTAAKRFLREARLASALSHPNTISMIDFGQCDDGRLFIAMELLRGKTLDKVLEGGPLPHDRVLRSWPRTSSRSSTAISSSRTSCCSTTCRAATSSRSSTSVSRSR
jgi:serine/threonine-protein kinase